MIRLQQLRYDAGLTPEQLSERLDGVVSGKTIRNIENGTRPRPATARAIAEHFGVTATELLMPVVPTIDDTPAAA